MDQEAIKVKILQEIDKTEKQIAQCRERIKPIAPDNAIGRILVMPETRLCVNCAQ